MTKKAALLALGLLFISCAQKPEVVYVERKNIPGQENTNPPSIKISLQEAAVLEKAHLLIRKGEVREAIAVLEDSIIENRSKPFRCLAFSLLNVAYLKKGKISSFLAYGRELVENCRAFRRLPETTQVLCLLYSTWSNDSIPEDLSIKPEIREQITSLIK
ncbi:tetratricopeptide repeat protein [Hydrogenivirga sp. 128-5-R1-1]|uniref:tetratricopeptide repeat protein n=1 Tax=Hydrogenivirga sp. 128-5-R1-1 TaxID=392423 RepID=UPI00015F3360|nr:tetratricopeptide repeat protein [Hydrogenivirga sp. 128-5-R1-1]EDP74859.1 hypothetical protein HG1285_13362 [Hydrogenivirga sp. 128-5-R1-1]